MSRIFCGEAPSHIPPFSSLWSPQVGRTAEKKAVRSLIKHGEAPLQVPPFARLNKFKIMINGGVVNFTILSFLFIKQMCIFFQFHSKIIKQYICRI